MNCYNYLNLDNESIADDSGIELTWTAYDRLPKASEDYYMTLAVINKEGSDYVYLCIRRTNTEYTWNLICRAGGKLEAPIVTLIADSSVITWDEIADAVGYEIYSDGEVVGSTLHTSFTLSEVVIKPGVHRIEVVAKAAEESDFEDSPLSDAVEYTVFDSYFKYVDAEELISIPGTATKANLPLDFKTAGVTVHYKTVGEQYEYFAYPATYNKLQDVIQSGQHVLGNYTKLDNVIKDGIEYHVYRTTLQQVYDDSDYCYCVFKIN